MAFLRRKDYLKQIQSDNLGVVIDDDDSIRRDAELAAQSEIESYLRHRYDMLKVFVDLFEYDNSQAYLTGQLVAYPDIEEDIYTSVEDQSGVSPEDDPGKWTIGDTRHPLIKMYLIDITLYHLHSRINPRNIPDFRMVRRDEAIKWFKMIADGNISADLPLIEPLEDEAGINTRWDSNTKFNHSY